MKIIIKFLNQQAVNVAKDIGYTGYKESIPNKMIVNRSFEDKVINDNPYIVEITAKIPWLAKKIGLDMLIHSELQTRNLVLGEDYTLEVIE